MAGPGRRGIGPKPKLKHPGKTFSRLIRFVAERYLVQLIIILICILVNAFASVQGTMFMKTLIDDYISPMLLEEVPNFAPLLHAISRVALIYLFGVLANFLQQRIMIYVSQGSQKRLRDELFEHMEKLPVKYFDTHAHGDIMSTYTNDIDTLRQMISQSLPMMISSAVTIVCVLVSMIILSIPLTILTLFMVFVTVFFSGKFSMMSGKNFAAQQKSIGGLNGYIEEMINGQKVVKVFCYEDRAIKRFNELNDTLFDDAYNANKFANVLGPINAQIGNISYVLCAALGGFMAVSGLFGLTVGGLASFLSFNKSFSMPVNQVTMQFNAIIMALAGAERIFDLMDEEAEFDDGYVELVNASEENGVLTECEKRTGIWAWKDSKNNGEIKRQEGGVIFDGVDFGYVPEKQVLNDIQMYAKPGQKIALVGSTGAGKTTITNLINRFYDIDDGKIRYDGININRIKKSELRKSMAVVLQETHLFTGSVADNIRFGKLDATDEEVVAAAKLANADSFIRQLPDGYNTRLTGNGANLSQGQRQLLSIARAAIADPPVLILDEATSSIDTRTEKIVQSGMDRLMKGRTVFVIAHRLSTIMNSNCIMVMEKGEIVERGTHDELLMLKGRYYRLFTGDKAPA